MMEEKWERVGEETSLQHMHLKKKKRRKKNGHQEPTSLALQWWLNMTMVSFNLPSKLSQMVAFNLPSISSRTSKNPLKSQNPLSKEMDEMRNRMREMGVKECLVVLANPRPPFP
jgi:hypothetical protein